MNNRHIEINVPVLARVEGEGALDLRIDNGVITDLKLRIYEPPRYFEKFLEGRSYTDVADTVARICGICPVAYQMSAINAIESIFKVQLSPWARGMRRLMYCGEWIQSHSLHIHMLAAPDFLGFKSVIEMSQEYGDEVRRGLKLQGLGNDLIRFTGGRSVHPVNVRAGGFFHAPDETAASELLDRLVAARQDAAELVAWTASLDLADDEQSFISVSLQHADEYAMDRGRLVSDSGLDIAFEEFDEHFRELHVPQSTALHCLLHDQPYLVGPLARLNNNLDSLPEETRALLDSTGIVFPSRNMFHSIVARALEVHYALNEAIRLLQNYQQAEHASEPVEVQAGVGFGCTEAPRGFLWHRYELDSNGLVVSARIVPPTSQNQARIEQDIGAALNHFGLEQEDHALQLHAEKVIRNYDPCISCATHFLKMNVERASSATNLDNKPVCQDQAHTQTLIAIGSPFTPDDIAWTLTDSVQQQLDALEVKLVRLDRPGTDLLNHLQQPGRVVLLDAVLDTTITPGLVFLSAEQCIKSQSALSSHDIGLASTLALAATLGQQLEHVTVIGIPVIRDGDQISITTSLDTMREQLLAYLQQQ